MAPAAGPIEQRSAAIQPIWILRERTQVRHRHVECEPPVRAQMVPAAGQRELEIVACEQVGEGVERRDHQREAPAEREPAHVTALQRDACAYVVRQSSEVCSRAHQHVGREVDAHDLDASLRKRDSDPAGAHAELEDRAAVAACELHVVAHVLLAAAIELLVEAGVAVQRACALAIRTLDQPFENAVAASGGFDGGARHGCVTPRA
jgi:hypothetical protein